MQLENIGKWKVFAIESGFFKLDGGAMMGSVPKVLWQETNPPDQLNRIDLSLRCLLVDDGENVVLIESGIGDKNPDKFKKMGISNIRKLGKKKHIIYEVKYIFKSEDVDGRL